MTWGIESESGEVIGLEDGRVHTAGRNALNHVVIEHSSVSNRHAELVATERGIEVRDSALKPPTKVAGELLNGGRAIAAAGDVLRFGTVSFRVVDDAPDPPDFWDVEAAFERLEAGANSTHWKGVWTRWWRGFDWRPIKGQFGKRGASFWLRAFERADRGWAKRTGVVDWLRGHEAPDAIMTLGDVEALLEGLRFSKDLGVITYLAQELIGARPVLDVLLERRRGSSTASRFDWLTSFEPDDELVARARELPQEDAYALLVPMFGHVGAARRLPTSDTNQPVNRWAEARGADDRALFEIAMEGFRASPEFVRRFAESSGDDDWKRLHEALLDRSLHRRLAGPLATRPVVSLTERFVLRADEFTWEMGAWPGALGASVAPSFNRIWRRDDDAARRRVVQVIGLMPDAGIRACWDQLDSDLKQSVTERFGRWIAADPAQVKMCDVPECLGNLAAQVTVPERMFEYRDATEWKELDLSDAPRVWSRAGELIPSDVVRGVVATCVARRAFRGRPNGWNGERFASKPTRRFAAADGWGPLEFEVDGASGGEDPNSGLDEFDIAQEQERSWPVRKAWRELVEPRSSFRLWWYLDSIRPTLSTWYPDSWTEFFLDDATAARELLEHEFARVDRNLKTVLFGGEQVGSLFYWWGSWLDDRSDALGNLREEVEDDFPTKVPDEAAPMADALVASYVRRPRRWGFGRVSDWMESRDWVRRSFSRVVWQSDHGGEPVCFWWSPEGEVTDVEQRPIELPDDATVWVTRGDAMPPDLRRRWANLFADHEILQASDQLAEPTAAGGLDEIARYIGSAMDWYRLGDDWDFDWAFENQHYPDGGVTVKRLDFGVWGGARLVIEGDYSSRSRQLIAVVFFDEHGDSIDAEDAPEFIVHAVIRALGEIRES